MQNSNSSTAKLIGLAVFGLMVLILLFSSFGSINASQGEIGIKTRMGQFVGILDGGFYVKAPFIESVHTMSVKTLTVRMEKNEDGNASLASASKDLQDVAIGVVVNYHIDGSKVNNIFMQYNSVENFQANVIEPIIRKTVKETSAQYTAEELVTKRAELAETVDKTLRDNFAAKDAILETINITNLDFSESFTKSIEAKVTAEQDALTAKNKLEQVKYEAEQKIESSKAEAEAIRIQAQAITSQGGEDYVKLKAIYQWDGHGCVSNCFGSGTQMPVPFLNMK